MRILGLRGLSLARLVKHSVMQFFVHAMPTHASAVSYQLIFSFFPFVIFFIALLGVFDLSNVFDWLRQQSEAFFLQQTTQQLNQIFDQLQQRRTGMLSFGVVGALWAASSGMRSMMRALNVVYGVMEGRSLWKLYALSLVYTLGLGVMVALVTILVVVSPQAIQALSQQFGMEPTFAVVWTWWLRWPFVVILLTATVALVYGLGPDVQQRFRFVTPGAFLAVVAWIGASLAFNFYIRNIWDVDALYGSVGTVIVLLLYVFISSVIVLFGAEINAVIEEQSVSGKNPGEKISPLQ
ncbi:MAG: YihY/virulence factor BrkB family protein [Herminiimonas sp.]|nr:YihY/virulence factor BrkB family protein [Herminiimonas sp.]